MTSIRLLFSRGHRTVAVFAVIALSVTLVSGTKAQQRTKKPLDHEAYDIWNRIENDAISTDGQWAHYTVKPGKGDATLRIRSTTTDEGFSVRRGAEARFTYDSRFAVYLIEPDEELVKKAKKEAAAKPKGTGGDDNKDDDAGPKKTLEILDLGNGRTFSAQRVKSFAVPKEAAGWVAYLLERPPKDEAAEPGAKRESGEGHEPASEEPATEEPAAEIPTTEEPAAAAQEPAKEEPTPAKEEPKTESAASAAEESGEDADDDNKKMKELGTQLVLRDLNGKAQYRYANVVEYQFSEDGQWLLYTASAEEGEEDGLFAVEVGTDTVTQALSGKGNYKSLAIDKAGRQAALLTDRDDFEAKPPAWAVYHWRTGSEPARAAATAASKGVPDGWQISEHRGPSFSENGGRLFFGTAPRPEEETSDDAESDDAAEDDDEDEEADDDEKVNVDIWHWKDPLLQPNQLKQLEEEQKRSYLAVLELDDDRIVQLGTEEVPEVTVGSDGDAAVALGISGLPYRMLRSWEYPFYSDVYVVDVGTGDATLAVEKLQGTAALSPEAKYITWWDSEALNWFAMSVEKRELVNLSELLPYPAEYELHDTPARPRPYGAAGWVEGDHAFLIYDRHDIWATNPEGFWPPMCVTDRIGRAQNLRFRYVKLDPEEKAIPADEPIMLSAFDEGTKASGFYRDTVRGAEEPQKLIMRDELLAFVAKAKDAPRVLFIRASFERFNNLWTANLDFEDMRQVSDANPQQRRYLWGTAELVRWSSLDGAPLEGILYKPEEFDPAKQYPLMVYFYERNSDRLHRHVIPETSRASINFSFYVSRGYVLFVPDIPYRVGYPGQSAVNAVLPGISSLIDQGFIDHEKIGVQGHSWGGYQTAYLVTRTNLFAAAEAGAPVSNMTSAYGGIRWQTGLSRMFQYEKTQSRIGGTLWDAQQKYIENSPLFWADKIETPLLILHNDEDGAVPWYQGIELFVSMRRLDKPVWMFNYNGEAHGLTKEPNKRDWAIRMQQFFDHYLLDAPAPVWLDEGVPAIKKGKTLGLELVGEESAEN